MNLRDIAGERRRRRRIPIRIPICKKTRLTFYPTLKLVLVTTQGQYSTHRPNTPPPPPPPFPSFVIINFSLGMHDVKAKLSTRVALSSLPNWTVNWGAKNGEIVSLTLPFWQVTGKWLVDWWCSRVQKCVKTMSLNYWLPLSRLIRKYMIKWLYAIIHTKAYRNKEFHIRIYS